MVGAWKDASNGLTYSEISLLASYFWMVTESIRPSKCLKQSENEHVEQERYCDNVLNITDIYKTLCTCVSTVYLL